MTHIEKVSEIMRGLSPVHRLKVMFYAETLQQIELEQQTERKENTDE